MSEDMNDNQRDKADKLHHSCKEALGKLLKEGEEMCRLLSLVKRHPATATQRRAIVEQRVKENRAQMDYDTARQALFLLAGWI